MTAVLSSTPEAVPEGFADVAVELSLCAVYLAARLDDQSNPAFTRALHQALQRKGIEQDRVGLIRQARGGMPDAIVPFHRQELDVYFAAGLLAPDARLVLRGSANSVEVGYFHCDRGTLKYVDTFERPTGFSVETLNMANTQALLANLRQGSDAPTVQVANLDGAELLRIDHGASAFMGRARKAASRAPADPKRSEATITLLKMFNDMPDEPAGYGARVNRVAWGEARWGVEGAVDDVGGSEALEDGDPALVLYGAKPEFVMELHAACIAAQAEGEPLWLHVGLRGAEFFCPAPDLLSPGATAQGWFAPYAAIGRYLGASAETNLHLPRWVAIEMLRRHRWLWSRNWPEWVRWAWYLDNT